MLCQEAEQQVESADMTHPVREHTPGEVEATGDEKLGNNEPYGQEMKRILQSTQGGRTGRRCEETTVHPSKPKPKLEKSPLNPTAGEADRMG